jgi:chromosome partitioning protein
MAKIIAITNQKGGVGKTTTAINLSACLAAAERKTLLLDLDPQGNASVGLGLDKTQFAERNVYHALVGDESIENCIYSTELPGLDICPSDNNLVGAEIELVSALARETKLKNALATIRDRYDYIIIDCAPSLNVLAVNALNAADSFLVPMQTEFLAMEGLSQLLNTVRLIRSSLNPHLQLEGILLTMYDSRNNLSKLVAQDLMDHFKDDIMKSIIPRNVKLSECPSHGKPIILYDITSKGSEAYLSLAKEIILKSEGKGKAPVEEAKAEKVTAPARPTLPRIPSFDDYEINH